MNPILLIAIAIITAPLVWMTWAINNEINGRPSTRRERNSITIHRTSKNDD